MSNAWIVETDLLFDGSGRAPERDRAVLVRDGRIAGVGATDAGAAIPRLRCPVLAPGFLDIQINGAADAQFNDDPSVETLRRMARGAAQGGSAWILPTFITAPGRAYAEALDAVAAALGAGVPGIAGLHLEGPFLSPRRAGIHPPEAIRRPDATDLARLEAPGGGARLVTLAPEEVGPDAVARLSAAGWTVFAGHSEATAEDLVPAVAAGLSGATHLFNAMSQMTPRAPGLVGAVLGGLVPHAGLIADGHHVHPLSLAAALKAVGADRLCLVTDAMRARSGSTAGGWSVRTAPWAARTWPWTRRCAT